MRLRHGLLAACAITVSVALASGALAGRSEQRLPLRSDELPNELEQAAARIARDAQVTQKLTTMLYQHMVGHRSNLRAEALKAFLAVEATPVVRQALLARDSRGLVVGAAKYLGEKQDVASLPLLIYALEQANFFQPGSEDATAHGILQSELVSAIGAITGLQGEADAILPYQRGRQIGDVEIGRFVGRVRQWAKEHNIDLWPPAEPVRWGPKPPLELEDRMDNLIRRAQSAEEEVIRDWAREKLIQLRSRIDAGLSEPAPTTAREALNAQGP